MQKQYTIIGAVVIIILIILGIKLLNNSDEVDEINVNTVSTTTQAVTNTTNSATTIPPVSTADWKVYKAAGDMVQFAYPANWTLTGTTLKSPSGAITINSSYKSGSLPKCDPSDCSPVTINGLTYLRTQTNGPTGTDISYNVLQKGFLFNSTAKLVNDVNLAANIALVNQIAGTVIVKAAN